ncbi:hypothetical protein [Terricaulis sp.]|uniref:hypothetical protein n=1 Tax=Terricaulis sp. TaxID=2768686 RepID=UPI003784157F
MTGRRASDWLDRAAANQNSGATAAWERRNGDRRAPRRRFDPLFAATLVNQIAPAETKYTRGYVAAPKWPPRGIVVNTRA